MSKKTLTTAVAVVLALAIAVGGTLAYLQDTTQVKTNDFRADSVEVDLTETDGTYRIVPGFTQTKDPKITASWSLPSFLFVQVTEDVEYVDWEIADGWTEVTGYPGVYVRELSAATNGLGDTGTNVQFDVLKDNKVTYNSAPTSVSDGTLSFQAYIIQRDKSGTVDANGDLTGMTAFDAADAWLRVKAGSTGLSDADAVVPVTASPNATPAENGAAITTAINNAKSASDVDTVAVVLGEGEYQLPAALDDGTVSIVGDGADNTTLDLVNYNSHADMQANISGVTVINSNNNNTQWKRVVETDFTNTTFTDCTFDAADSGYDNAIYNSKVDGEVVFENCTISAGVYGINFGNVDGTLILRNCDITGWNSFGGASTAGGTSKVIIENCRFHRSTAGYNVLRFYQDAEVTNCKFDKNFMDTTADTYGTFKGGIDVYANNVTIRMDGNKVVESNGTEQDLAVTAENFANNRKTNVTWIINGNNETDTIAAFNN